MGNRCLHRLPVWQAARRALSSRLRPDVALCGLRSMAVPPVGPLWAASTKRRLSRAFSNWRIPADVKQSRHLTFSTAHIRGMHEPSQVSPGIDLGDQQPARHSADLRWLVSHGRAARVWSGSSRSRPSALLSDCGRLAVSRAWMEAAAHRRNTFDARHFRFRAKRAAWIQARRHSHADHLRSALVWAPHVHGPAGYAGSLWTAQSEACWIAPFITVPPVVCWKSAQTPSRLCRSAARRSPRLP